MSDPIRIFIGGGPEHWLPTRVLEHSILARTERPVDVRPLLYEEKQHPIPERWKRKLPTSFSLQRFLVPAACGYAGKGIYLDSDMVVQDDIGGLWDTPFPEGANVLTTGGWQSAVMLIDCASARWDIDELCAGMDAGRYKYAKLSNLRYPDVARVEGALDRRWNCRDKYPGDCKLLHYTAMRTQPWLKADHPCGLVWTHELGFAISEGFITAEQVMAEIEKRHVRPSLALLVNERQPYPDKQFVFPDDVRKRKQRKRKAG